ncbi:MAG: hypothetical protein HYS98_08065 [Deltaproteobacteria bacterium]|nr:hypothetical protein [Deltaproteobacteria bacterium]
MIQKSCLRIVLFIFSFLALCPLHSVLSDDKLDGSEFILLAKYLQEKWLVTNPSFRGVETELKSILLELKPQLDLDDFNLNSEQNGINLEKQLGGTFSEILSTAVDLMLSRFDPYAVLAVQGGPIVERHAEDSECLSLSNDWGTPLEFEYDEKENVLLIRVNHFGVTHYQDVVKNKKEDEFLKCLKKLKETLLNKQYSAILIDLRDNPGGKIINVKDFAELFIEEGKLIMMFYRKMNRKTEIIPVYSQQKSELQTTPIVVFVNKNTASGAEITAQCLEKYTNAQVIGGATFGKTTAQTPLTLLDNLNPPIQFNAMLRITVLEFKAAGH